MKEKYAFTVRTHKDDRETIRKLCNELGMSQNKMVRYAIFKLMESAKHNYELLAGSQAKYFDSQSFNRTRYFDDSAEGFAYIADELNDDYQMMIGELLDNLTQDLTDIDDINTIRFGLFYDVAWGTEKGAREYGEKKK